MLTVVVIDCLTMILLVGSSISVYHQPDILSIGHAIEPALKYQAMDSDIIATSQ